MSYEVQNFDTLDDAGRLALASQLGESPETTISLHALRSGEAVALAVGTRAPFRAALVTWTNLPDWPHGYGEPALIVELLASSEPWGAVCVESGAADIVASILTERTGKRSHRLAELFYLLRDPPEPRSDSAARELGPDDLALLAPTAADLDVADPSHLLNRCLAAGVVVEGQVVALAHNGASSQRYGDVAVATLEGHRRRGYASACGHLVAQRIFESGRQPVWCTNAENLGSRHTAAAIGFAEVGRRENVFLESDVGSEPL
jgi:hypothetical protein